MSIYLVTGVNGFIGSHTARRVLKEGHNVRGLVRSTSNLDYIKDLDIELVYGDVCRMEILEKAAQGVEQVIHTAGLAKDWGNYDDFHKVNYQGTCNLVQAAEKAGVKRFVHISTTAIHGFGFRAITEDYSMADKLNYYAETKKMAERWLFQFARGAKIEVVGLRPGNVYGPDDHTFIDKYLNAIYTGKFSYVNNGRSLTCPVYIDNLVEAIWLACHSEAAVGEVFFITDGLEITWKEFTDKLAEALQVKKPQFSIPYGFGYSLAVMAEGIYKLLRIKEGPLITKYRVGNGGLDYHFSIAKAQKLLNYRPLVGLDEAVKKTAQWYLRILDNQKL
ncbi:MAG: NAD-dependent epimerase/dehydratase family protein [Acidobacteria bacterium]|nr:NAD-dependent epimerase/dehydratase family protein [Acidobacteriota bacterium]